MRLFLMKFSKCERYCNTLYSFSEDAIDYPQLENGNLKTMLLNVPFTRFP